MDKTPSTEKTRIIRNSFVFTIPQKQVKIGLHFKEQKHLKRLQKKRFKDYCRDTKILHQTEEFVWLDLEVEDADAPFSFYLDKAPYLASWYYENQCYSLLKKQLRITRRTFTGAFQYWVENTNKKTDSLLCFQKFNLYFDLRDRQKNIAITLAYEGESKVLYKACGKLG